MHNVAAELFGLQQYRSLIFLIDQAIEHGRHSGATCQGDIMRVCGHDRQAVAVGRLRQKAGYKVQKDRVYGRVGQLAPLSLLHSQARDD